MAKVLIVVDVQNYFVNEHTATLPAKIAKYLNEHSFPHILFTRTVNHPNSFFVKRLGWKKCFETPEIDIHETLLPFAKQAVIFDKATYSIFKYAPLLQFLRKNEIQKMSLCGIDTDACILASAYDGFDLGYEVSILSELTASHYGEVFMEAALKIIRKNLVKSTRGQVSC
ncbi:MAG: cysteine hydrolase [Deltaproteobacteria bacterium]|nr:cysteine hydrolase [Deltaproteobacteria bacterium]